MIRLNNVAAEKDYLIVDEKFSGPIYLLLELVQKKKVDIYEIKLSTMIGGFIEHIENNKDILFETLSGFIYFASILIEIKSRSLIPSKSKASGEGEDELDINILRRREEEYKVYKKISNYFSSLFEKESLFFIREAPIEKQFLEVFPDFLKDVKPEELAVLASRLLSRKEESLDLENIYDLRASINIFDEMERIKDILSKQQDISFRELTSRYDKVIDKIVSFLSILELYKNEMIEIVQFDNFGKIIIKRAG